MNLDLVFSVIIYLLVIVLLVFVFKVYINTKRVKNKWKENYFDLLESMNMLKEENKAVNNKIVLVEGLYKTLFNRLFKINTELILAQKLFFDKRT